MVTLFLEGLVLQASLIFALGSQNLFVLEAGLRRENYLAVSFVCFICDMILILLGVAGAATLFTAFPELKIGIGLLGVAFLFFYGMTKIFSDTSSLPLNQNSQPSLSLKKSLLLALTFSVLNPHAYLDAFILIGGFSTKYNLLEERLVLGLGAGVYSGIWFLLLSTLSSVMKPVLENPLRMRMVMTTAGVALIVLSGKLGLDVLGWLTQSYGNKLVSFYPPSPGAYFTAILF